MQYSTLYASAAAFLASTCTALAVPRTSTQDVFKVRGFYASGGAHSLLVNYKFNVTDGESEAQCHSTVSTGPYVNYSPPTNCTPATDQETYTFSFLGNIDGNYDLKVNKTTSANHLLTLLESGIHTFPASAIVTHVNLVNPNGNYQSISAPSDFDIPTTTTSSTRM